MELDKKSVPGWTRRAFLKSSALMGGLAPYLLANPRAFADSEVEKQIPMNIIYIHCHDAGRYLSPYGHTVPAPNLENFARESIVFTQAFCNAPTCSPSRAALLTGMTAHQAGMLGLAHRGFSLIDNDQHLCRVLAKRGYETALCGIQHEWNHKGPPPPYETIIPQEGVEDRENIENDLKIGRAASAYLRERRDERPLFLSVGFYYPHRVLPPADPQFPADRAPVPPPLPDNEVVRGDMASYQTAAWWMDKGFGEVWNALKETGMTENSLILFTTDHGIPFPKMKANLTDHGMGVAFILRPPGMSVERRSCDAMISHLDYFPTVCDYAGLPIPARCLGRSLRPLLENHPNAAGDEEVFAEVNFHAGYEPKRAIRTATHKYIRNYELAYHPAMSNIDPGPTKSWMVENGQLPVEVMGEELYDLSTDPDETHNLAASAGHAGVLGEMRERLDRWMRHTDDPLRDGHVTAPPGAIVEPPSMPIPKAS